MSHGKVDEKMLVRIIACGCITIRLKDLWIFLKVAGIARMSVIGNDWCLHALLLETKYP